jgi:hypothetical protein
VCEAAYCGTCFEPHELDQFEVKVPRDFHGASLAEVEDEVRYRVARPGDHLCSAFQCPNCQSQNVRGRSLVVGDAQDEAFDAVATRATLDAFWTHASRTVAGHVTEVRFMSRYAEALDVDPFPALGPFPLGEHLGMKEALMIVMRAMEPGRKGTLVQFGTARKPRSTLTVLWESSPESGADIVLASGGVKGRYIASHAPSEGRWFQQFMQGIQVRMGDEVDQDRAYSTDIILALLAMFEKEWEEMGSEIPLHSLRSVMFLLVSCLGGMRGYEVVWTDLGALNYDLDYCKSLKDESAVAWPVVGRFKARGGVADCYMVPIAGTTKSGMKFLQWTQRFADGLARAGKVSGWAFMRPDGTRALAADYKDNIFSKLEELQQTTNLIDPACNVWRDFGTQRSGRRWFTSECANKGVPKHEVELQCRWSTDRANGERTVQRSMIHTYSEMRNMKETLIRPSKSL